MNARKTPASQRTKTRLASVSPIAAQRIAMSAIMRRGSATAAAASIRRVDGVLASPSPAIRLPIAVANTSAPGATRSNGVANASAAPVAVTPTTTTLPLSASGSTSSRRSRVALMRRKLPAGP